jgi:hypothetical protein
MTLQLLDLARRAIKPAREGSLQPVRVVTRKHRSERRFAMFDKRDVSRVSDNPLDLKIRSSVRAGSDPSPRENGQLFS